MPRRTTRSSPLRRERGRWKPTSSRRACLKRTSSWPGSSVRLGRVIPRARRRPGIGACRCACTGVPLPGGGAREPARQRIPRAQFGCGEESLLRITVDCREPPMPATIRPIILTAHLDRLLAFYTGLLGAEELLRFPEDGPVFYVGLGLGDSE